MIPKAAVKAFLDAPRDDFRPWKFMTDDELLDIYDKLPIDPPIYRRLRRHQKVCFLLGALHQRFAFFLDTGSGKTLLSIALARYFRRLKKVNRVLVLVPNRINLYEWRREIEKHSSGTSYAILSGSSADKWKILEESDALLNVVTYMGLVRMVGDLVKRKPKRGQKAKKGNQVKPSSSLLRRMRTLVDGLILDESTAVANHASLPFRVVRQLAKDCEMLFDLTGTPFGRDPQPLWTQMYLVDNGYTLGPTLGLFREAFYTSSQNYWGGFDYAFKSSMSDTLNRVLAHRSIRYEADQADLPQVTRIITEVPMPLDAEAYMETIKKDLQGAQGNYQEMKNSFLRARQLAAGFVGFKDDETGDRAQFEFESNPKVEALLDLVQSIREDYKIVVGYDFIFTGKIISRALRDEKIEHVLMSGKTRDAEAQLTRFVKDPKCRVFVLNTSGAFGLNLQMARYIVFFESPVPVILRKQMERRVERQGSKYQRVFMYDLVMRRTYDRRILQFHEEGKDLFEAIVDGRVGDFGR